MGQSTTFGFVALGLFIQLAIYCLIALVVWRFYQMISRITEDVSAIRKQLKRRSGEPDLDLEIPSDPLE
jgi:type II secretory pathway component PulJ